MAGQAGGLPYLFPIARPCPGEEAFVCDGALYQFEVALGSTRFSYQWHTIPPKGWEPVAEWLGGAIRQLGQLAGTPSHEY